MHKKFFLISQVFYPDEVSTAGLFTQLCKRMVERNISVEVWCAQPSYNENRKQPRNLVYKGISIHYLPSTNFRKNSFLGRLLNYFTFTISLVFKFVFSEDKSTVFTSTNPPYLGFIIAWLCRLKRRKFVYLIQDVFPEGLVRIKKLSEGSIVVKFWNRLNKYTLIQSDKIIVLGRDMKAWLTTFDTRTKTKTLIIPIWQDEQLIQPLQFSKSLFVKENRMEGKFVIQYSGNMGLWNDMTLFAEVIKQVKDPAILFTFIGDGIRKKEMYEAWDDIVPDNVQIYSFQPKSRLNDLLAACHIALVSLREGAEGMAVPSKIMGILASGRPTIAVVPKESEISFIINEVNCGIQVNPGDVSGFLKAIELLKTNFPLREEMGRNARKAFENKYSVNIVVEKYINLID